VTDSPPSLPSIPYGCQDIDDRDIAAVEAALRKPFLTQGPAVAEFEARLAHTVGAAFAVAFNSGTAALHAAYFAAGIRAGRSVLTTPITFAATTNAALYLGGGVHFADVEPSTALLSPEAVEDCTASDVHVVTPVHFSGHAAAMESLASIAARRGWRIVEDAAHALGASYRTADGAEYWVGACAHSDMCCFSFHPVKHITTGEGGAVTTNDVQLYRALVRFRSHGITRDPAELSVDEGPWYYEQHDLGFNYRITDFQCALGSSQLERLPEFVERRRAIAAYYDDAFRDETGLTPLRAPEWSRGSYHLYVIQVPARARRQIFERLRAAGLGVNVHYIPVYRHPYYRTLGLAVPHCPNAEHYYAGAISIPMFPGLGDPELGRIVTEVKRHVREASV
jgi:perosamine synthetase